MATIKVTAKRQATLPVDLCEEMGIKPGDELEVTPRVEGGQRLWVLRPKRLPTRPWFGALKRYADRPGLSHSMDEIRNSIGRSVAAERLGTSD